MPRNHLANPGGYDDYATIQKRCFEELISGLPSSFSPQSILDIGCATGTHTASLSQRFPNAEILGIDASAPRIKYAQKHYPHISFQAQSFEELPMDRSWNCIVANASLHWITPLHETLEKCSTLLEKKGVFMASIFGRDTFKEWGWVLDTLGISTHFPSRSFDSAESIVRDCTKLFSHPQLKRVSYKVRLDSLPDLLKSIRMTGTGGRHGQGLWTPRLLKKAGELYLHTFGGFYATSDVVLVWAEKN